MQLKTFRQESQKRIAELNALREIAELTQDGISVDQLLKLILNKAMQVIAVRNGSVFLVDPAEADGLRLIAVIPDVLRVNDAGGQKFRRYSFLSKASLKAGRLCLSRMSRMIPEP